MLRGILAGALWGGLIGLITLALSSQLADWRDLRPAVTEATVEEQVPDTTDAPDATVADTPEVRADDEPPRAEPAEAPVVAEIDPNEGGAAIQIEPPEAPGADDAPQVAGAPDDSGASPQRPSDSTPVADPARNVAAAPAPESDAPPTNIATETAPVPARLGPEAQEDVETPGVPDVDTATPGLPEPANDAPEPTSTDTAVAVEPADADAAPAEPETPPAAPVEVAAADPVEPEAPDQTAAAPEIETSDAPDVAQAGGALESAAPSDAAPDTDAAPAEPTDVASDAPEITAPEATDAPDAPMEVAEAPNEAMQGTQLTREAVADAPPDAPDAPEATARTEPVQIELPQAGDTVEATDAPDADDDMAQADSNGADTPTVEPKITRIGGDGERLPGARIRRLPTVGDSEASAPEDPEVAAVAVEPNEEAEGGNAIARNAIAFEAPDGAALVSLVLIHGDDAAAPEESPIPLTFAIPASRPDAADLAEAYRAMGHEVLLVPDLPDGARAQDVEVALTASLADMPDIIGLLDPDGSGFNVDRQATAQAISTAGRAGLGVVSIARGFNSASRLAGREGVASADIDREIESGETDRRAIARVLDQAAFRARSGGNAVVLAQATDAQIGGILSWALENENEALAIAPISAVLSDGE